MKRRQHKHVIEHNSSSQRFEIILIFSKKAFKKCSWKLAIVGYCKV